jgi:hypothetical protein
MKCNDCIRRYELVVFGIGILLLVSIRYRSFIILFIILGYIGLCCIVSLGVGIMM